jgi:putative spermidine/putrescine transport system permease protein
MEAKAPFDIRWLLVPALLLQAVLFYLPLLIVLQRSLFDPALSLANYQTVFGEPVYFRVMVMTFGTAAFVTAITAVIGYPIAYLMAHSGRVLTGVLLLALLVPLWTNLVARTFALQVVLGREGFINRTLEALGLINEPLTMLYNIFPVLLGMTQALLPFMVLPTYAIMRGIDPSLVPAAHSLGATGRQSFRTIYFPLSMPGLITSITLTFILAMGFVVTPLILGGPTEYTIGALITVQMRQELNWGLGSALAITLLVATSTIVYVYQRRYGLDRLLGGIR